MVTTHCPACGLRAPASIGRLSFISETRVVTFDGKTCRLTPKQLDILEELMDAYPGHVSRGHLMDVMYAHYVDDNLQSFFVQMSCMRRAFRDAGMPVTIINSSHGLGYRLFLSPEDKP